MPSFFCGADALLVSLKSEPVFALTIPGKVQSYLASGVPLLGMLDGEGARVIEEAGAGLTCPAGDGAALAANVERLAATSVAEREAMGRRAVAYAEAEFDRDRLLNQLEEWLREVRTPGS
jgi:glycosyltransferase involved in cell wall biosynthesis